MSENIIIEKLIIFKILNIYQRFVMFFENIFYFEFKKKGMLPFHLLSISLLINTNPEVENNLASAIEIALV